MTNSHSFYQVGGTLPFDYPNYVERQADKDLYFSIKNGKLCFIFNSRQMGKSSLEVRTRKQLEKDGFSVGLLDLTNIGTQNVAPNAWYKSLADSLVNSFNLNINLSKWWREHADLTPIAQLNNFFEKVLLRQTSKQILITLDEIDGVLSLNFPTDDFFAFIRACYNQRSSHKEYRRLNFALFGVATPSQLIEENVRTPFNIGEAIELTGFSLEEAQPLAQGLEAYVDNPQATLAEILRWTGGQPFLTQKLCALITKENDFIIAGQEPDAIARLAESKVIQNWENQDQPDHLKTIRNRIIKSKQRTFRLLALYQQIRQNDSVPADNSVEQSELLLTGLITRKAGQLELYNPIYQRVFDETWVQQTLESLRPYVDDMRAWLKTGCEDESRLLTGRALKDGEAWADAYSSYITEEDQQFLASSRAYTERLRLALSEEISTAKEEAKRILDRYAVEVENISDRPPAVIQAIKTWADSQPSLVRAVCELLTEQPNIHIPTGEEATYIEAIILEKLRHHDLAAEHLREIQDSLRKDERFENLLELYKLILDQGEITADGSLDQRILLQIGLITLEDEKLKVSNQIYQYFFNQDWCDDIRERKFIDRYEIIETLEASAVDEVDISHLIQAYLVEDSIRPDDEKFVLKQIQLNIEAEDADLWLKVRRLFNSRIRELVKLNSLKNACVSELEGKSPFCAVPYIVYKYVGGLKI
ncbi:MAG: hypothetical protein F6K04_18865 [Leptolyngbya sp. SIO4C5]|nr:hypothetical protein [Leptolyngbya sp. SIO4C5]